MDSAKTPAVRAMLNKVPEVTIFFWVIKVLCTTVGETFADYLNETLKLGLANTSYLMGVLLLAILCVQFVVRRYIPAIYWLAVVLLSIVGTLITDNLTDNMGVSLVTTTVGFSLLLGVTFAAWYTSEHDLSVTSIRSTRREAFYWAAILFTFALGTAAGDLLAERLALGYSWSALIFAGAIALIALARYATGLNSVLAFWAAYILTRPLGASIGDYLSQAPEEGGLGLGTTMTSCVFLLAILLLVIYLSVSKSDVVGTQLPSAQAKPGARAGL